MSHGFNFSLAGTGYLHDVICQNDNVIAKINIINRFGLTSHSTDDVWINCHVKANELLNDIAELYDLLKAGKTIILEFTANYYGLDFCHSGMSDEDPKNILQFQGELSCIHKYFIDGINNDSIEYENIKKFAVL